MSVSEKIIDIDTAAVLPCDANTPFFYQLVDRYRDRRVSTMPFAVGDIPCYVNFVRYQKLLNICLDRPKICRLRPVFRLFKEVKNPLLDFSL